MFIVNHYIINQNFVLMMGEYDQNGNLCTRVVEVNQTFLVNKSLEKVLDESLNYAGYDLKGAVAGTRSILGKRKMCPFIVNPTHHICVFPHKSLRNPNCILFNLDHIKSTKTVGKHTRVYLSNGHFIDVAAKLALFNNKIQAATQLSGIVQRRGERPLTMIIEPKQRKQIIKEETGKYKIENIQEEEEEK